MQTATQTLIVKHLKEDDLCIHELGKILGMNPECLRYAIKKLLEKKLIKHVGWKSQKKSGRPLKLYSSVMYKTNAIEYSRLTDAEKSKNYREKFKAVIALRRKSRRKKKLDTNLFFI
jgi:predicted ArsR family transcriptional regulator